MYQAIGGCLFNILLVILIGEPFINFSIIFITAMSNQMVWSMGKHPVYLWTLPMFHCNGWCIPWTITALAGTHICLRTISAKNIYVSITKHNVTHMCGAPIILSMRINAEKNEIIDATGFIEKRISA